MRVLNLSGGISRNAASQTARRIDSYFSGCDITCGIFESENSEFDRLVADRGITTEYFGANVTDRFEEISLLPGVGYPHALAHALRARGEYDLVHVYGGPLFHGPIGEAFSAINNCPLITRFNGYVPLPDQSVKRTVVEKTVTRLLDSPAVVFNSHAQKDDILSTYDVLDSEKMWVIPPGIDESWYEPQQSTTHLRNELGLDSSTKIVGSVITPRPVKRLDRAFEIIGKVAKSTDVKYVILGDSTYLSTYKEKAREMGVDNSVHWAGHQDQEALKTWYSLFDATILTSEWESFGMSLTESYLCETPCVAFDVGGMSDQIVDGETGYLIEPYDTGAFTDALVNILSNDEQAAEFGASGRKYVRDRFTLESVSGQYRDLISTLDV